MNQNSKQKLYKKTKYTHLHKTTKKPLKIQSSRMFKQFHENIWTSCPLLSSAGTTLFFVSFSILVCFLPESSASFTYNGSINITSPCLKYSK